MKGYAEHIMDFADLVEVEIFGERKQFYPVDSTVMKIPLPQAGQAIIYEFNNKFYEIITWIVFNDRGNKNEKTVNILIG